MSKAGMAEMLSLSFLLQRCSYRLIDKVLQRGFQIQLVLAEPDDEFAKDNLKSKDADHGSSQRVKRRRYEARAFFAMV
jgi:hypothetical protein